MRYYSHIGSIQTMSARAGDGIVLSTSQASTRSDTSPPRCTNASINLTSTPISTSLSTTSPSAPCLPRHLRSPSFSHAHHHT